MLRGLRREKLNIKDATRKYTRKALDLFKISSTKPQEVMKVTLP